MKPDKLKIGDTIGVIAPSRPINTIKKKIESGIKIFEKLGYKIVLSKNINKHFYYSAGTPQQRASDLHEMFSNSKIKMIICATGGCSANQILPYINFGLIKKNPKIFVGYSDITTLLLAIYKKTGLITFHGPNLATFPYLKKEARDFFFDLVCGKFEEYLLPKKIEIIKRGQASGKLIGGNIFVEDSLSSTPYFPDYKNAIWFFEDIDTSPGTFHFRLMKFKLSGILNKVNAIIIGNFPDYNNEKNKKEDFRSIKDVVLEVTKCYSIPIVKVDYFGHNVKTFYTFPIGVKAELNTNRKEIKIAESPVI